MAQFGQDERNDMREQAAKVAEKYQIMPSIQTAKAFYDGKDVAQEIRNLK